MRRCVNQVDRSGLWTSDHQRPSARVERSSSPANGTVRSVPAFILFGGLTAFYLCGIPVAYWTYRRLPLTRRSDVLFGASPLVGMAVVSAVTRLSLAAGVPVKYSAWPILLIGLAATGRLAVRHRGGLLRAVRNPVNWITYFAVPFVPTVLIGLPYLQSDPEFWHGYAWWDVMFYGTQAELVKEHSLAAIPGMSQTQPWALVSMHFWEGQHRIGRAVVEAFAATLTGATGAATTGLVVIGGIWMGYGAVRFLIGEMELSEPYRTLSALAVAVAPTVLLAGLEGFLPSVYTFLLITALCRLLVDLLKTRSGPLVVTTSLVVSMMILVLMENIWVTLTLGSATFVFLALTRQARWRSLIHLAAMLGSSTLLAAPFLSELGSEIATVTSTRPVLNSIYPFGDSPQVFTWLLWGTTTETSPGTGRALTLIALGVALLGCFGILLMIWVRLDAVTFVAFCVAVSPLLLILGDQDTRYAFVKSLHFSFPILILGFCLAISMIADRVRMADVKQLTIRVARAVCTLVLVALVFGTGVRSSKLVGYSQGDQAMAYGRTDPIRYAFSVDQLENYQDYRNRSGEDILFISPGNENLSYWWSSFFLRNNSLYNLSPLQASLYSDEQLPTFADLTRIPISARLVYSPDYRGLGIDPSLRGDIACLVSGRNAQSTTLYTEDYPLADVMNLSINCFARAGAVMRFSVTLDPTSGPVLMAGGNTEVDLTRTEGRFEVRVPPGAHSVEFTLSRPTTIRRVTASVISSG